jgi:hypothetical protein
MNHSRFMEFQYIYQLFSPTYFSGLLIPNFDIPCHFQSSCICRTGALNHFLQICILFRMWCCILSGNLNLGLATKARTCKDAGQKWSLGVTFHALGNVGECEGMNPHTRKWTPIFGIEVPMDFRILKGWLQGSKLIALMNLLYHWKVVETWMSKMGSHDPFGYLKHKLWSKEGSRIKLPIWLPTTKSKKLPWFICV